MRGHDRPQATRPSSAGQAGWAGYVYLVLLPLVALWRWRRRSLEERDAIIAAPPPESARL